MGGVIKDLLNQIDNPGNERSGSRDFINGIGTLNSIMGKMNVMHVQQEKLQIAETIFETIENKARQLSLDKKNLDESEKAVIAGNLFLKPLHHFVDILCTYYLINKSILIQKISRRSQLRFQHQLILPKK